MYEKLLKVAFVVKILNKIDNFWNPHTKLPTRHIYMMNKKHFKKNIFLLIFVTKDKKMAIIFCTNFESCCDKMTCFIPVSNLNISALK